MASTLLQEEHPGPQFPVATPEDPGRGSHSPHPDFPMPLRANHTEKGEAPTAAQNHERILMTGHRVAKFKSMLKTDEGFGIVPVKVCHTANSLAPRLILRPPGPLCSPPWSDLWPCQPTRELRHRVTSLPPLWRCRPLTDPPLSRASRVHVGPSHSQAPPSWSPTFGLPPCLPNSPLPRASRSGAWPQSQMQLSGSAVTP